MSESVYDAYMTQEHYGVCHDGDEYAGLDVSKNTCARCGGEIRYSKQGYKGFVTCAGAREICGACAPKEKHGYLRFNPRIRTLLRRAGKLEPTVDFYPYREPGTQV